MPYLLWKITDDDTDRPFLFINCTVRTNCAVFCDNPQIRLNIFLKNYGIFQHKKIYSTMLHHQVVNTITIHMIRRLSVLVKCVVSKPNLSTFKHEQEMAVITTFVVTISMCSVVNIDFLRFFITLKNSLFIF